MSKKTQKSPKSCTETLQKFIFQIAGKGYSQWDIFRDFHAMAAISFRNSVALYDNEAKQAREKEYLRIINSYDKASQKIFPQILGELVLAMSERPQDICGRLFMDMDLGDSWKGQFFTPDNIADMMGKILWGNELIGKVNGSEFVTIAEPAVGSGVMMIALYNAILDAGGNPQQSMHVTATDIDIVAVYMAYVQFTLLNIPADQPRFFIPSKKLVAEI